MSNENSETPGELVTDVANETPIAEPPTPDPHRTRFQKGNLLRLKHGLRSRQIQGGAMPQALATGEALTARVDGITADMGGASEVSHVLQGLIERHARLELLAEHLWNHLENAGPFTGKGHTRAGLSAWLMVVDRLQKSSTTLGLSRKPKRAVSLAEVLEAHERRHE